MPLNTPKKIAIIGSGISGLMSAYLLNQDNEIKLFEADNYIGGHTATKSVEVNGKTFAIDTGFIVFNDRTYPNFIKLLEGLEVSYQPAEMSFSVSCQVANYEYSGSSIKGLFAQVENILNYKHWRMLREILRFNRECTALHECGAIDEDETLDAYLCAHGYSEHFKHYYIFPMVSAIWSSGISIAASMPLNFFIRFFYNHGLLSVLNQPQWFSLIGGSSSYITPLTESFTEKIHTSSPVTSVRRRNGLVEVTSSEFGVEMFDDVIFACHSDQALKILVDPSDAEVEILSALPYKKNDVILHSDINFLPQKRSAWASWNYLYLDEGESESAILTYNMNLLQNLDAPTTFCVSLNNGLHVSPDKVYGRYSYSHPQFTKATIAAQERWGEINGQNNTYYCGAYWRNGFHEDGVVSALKVAASLGVKGITNNQYDVLWKPAHDVTSEQV